MSIFKLDLNIKKHIPNAITCCNLICGCLAIVQIFEGNLVMAAYLVGLAAIFDFFDGFAARLLKVSSPIGKDLDSLADMVTFGVVPGFIMFKMLQLAEFKMGSVHGHAGIEETSWIPYVAILIPVFSALRLAKFNNDTRQSDSFIGVPTPANSILICSLPLIINLNGNVQDAQNFSVLEPYILNTNFLIVIAVVMSVLLVAEIPLIALKFKSFGWKGNQYRYVLIAISVLLMFVLKFAGLPLIIVFYILISLINNIVKR